MVAFLSCILCLYLCLRVITFFLILPLVVVGRFTYDIEIYCAFFDISIPIFGTEVDQYNYNEQIWGWSHRRTAPWRPWRPFLKMAATAAHESISHEK